MTIGIPKEYFDTGIDEGVKLVILKAIDDMKKLGAQVIDVSLPMTKYAMAVYYVLCPAEVATNLARLDGIRYGYSSEKSRENLEEFYIHNRGE